MARLFYFCMTVGMTIATSISSCSGRGFNGSGADKKNDKKHHDSANGSGDNKGTTDGKATEPEVVTGAYLACVDTTEGVDLAQGKAIVGCDMMDESKNKMDVQKKNLVFLASKNGSPDPTSLAPQTDSASAHQATFNFKRSDLYKESFQAEYTAENGTRQTKGFAGSKLSIATDSNGKISLTIQGSWQPKLGFDVPSFLSESCPLSPQEIYCPKPGGIRYGEYPANADSARACGFGSLGGLGAAVGQIGGMFNSASQIQHAKPLKVSQATHCIMPKHTSSVRDPLTLVADHTLATCYGTVIKVRGGSTSDISVFLADKASVTGEQFMKEVGELGICGQ